MITLNETQISDLFFNHDLVNYMAVPADASDCNDLERAALLEDARNFCEIIGNQVEPEWLVNNFFSRQ